MLSLLLDEHGKAFFKSIFKEAIAEILEEIKLEQSNKEIPWSSNDNKSNDSLLTRKEVSQMLKVSLTTLNNWQKSNILISCKVGKRVLYKIEDVEKAMQKQQSHSNKI